MCPGCGRYFGRKGQGHLCVPARQLDDFLADQPDAHRPIFEAVIDHVRGLEEAIIEPGDSYLMLKRRRKFAALMPRQKWVRMWFIVRRVIDHERIMSRTKATARGWTAHYVQLRIVDDVDETLLGWLTESYGEVA
jgi:hypothetical protein